MKTTKMKTMKTKKMESILMKMTRMLKVIPTNRTVVLMITKRQRRLRINRIKKREPLPRKHRQSLSCKSALETTMMMKMSGMTVTSLNRRRAPK